VQPMGWDGMGWDGMGASYLIAEMGWVRVI
jgi:hypothetical protein